MTMRKTAALLTSFCFFLSSCAHHPTGDTYITQTSYDEPGLQPEESVSKEQRNPSSPASDDPWTNWYTMGSLRAMNALKHIREDLLKNNLHDPHVNYAGYGNPIDCSKRLLQFRSADGTCTTKDKPYVGAAGVAFGRNVNPRFIDKDAAKKLMSPNPAVVSKEFFTRDEFKAVPFLNMLAAVWIQFMNHDWLTHGANMTKDPLKVQAPDGSIKTVERTKQFPNDPKMLKQGFDKVSANDVTHWWDASQIYGSNKETQMSLREKKDGKMRTVVVNGREILPRVLNFNARDNRQNQGYEETGFRDNWWVGLSMLHTLFVEEHNSIAAMLKAKNATFDAKSGKWLYKNFEKDPGRLLTEAQLDEQLFQQARLVNAAVLAKIHTVEWTPAILPNPTLKKAMYTNWYGLANPQTWSKFLKYIPGAGKTDWFKGDAMSFVTGGIVGNRGNDEARKQGSKRNDVNVPFSITEEFTSVYRLHSLLPEQLNFKKIATGNRVTRVPFISTRNDKSYAFMENNDLKDLYYSFGTQLPGQLVLNNFPEFMQNLEIPGHEPMDLGMVDIIRDRERGVPRYNQFRTAIGLKPVRTYRDFFPSDKPLDARQQKIVAKFEKVYGKTVDGKDNVNDIDLLVGTLAEEVRPKNFGFGETMFHIFVLMASRRLMADRFYTDDYNENVYSKAGLNWIDNEGRFAQVIVRHMPELKDKVAGLETAFLPWHQ